MPANNYPPCEWDVHLPIDAHLSTDANLLTDSNLHVRLHELLQNCLRWKARVYLP